MNKVEMLTKVNNKINKLKMKGMKHSPEILLLLGLAGAVTGTALACIATTKLPEVKAKKEEALAEMHERLDGNDSSEAESNLPAVKKETTAIYLKTGVRYVSLYAPAVLVSGLSLSCLVASNVILRKRLIGVSAAYATIAQSFKEYRGRVADRYGDEVEKEIRYNIQPQEITTTTVDGKGREKQKTEKIKAMDPSVNSDYARMFDDGCIGWTKDPIANLKFLRCVETAATKRLKAEGFLFLNDVYDMLGFPKTREGQVAGWVYNEENPVGDNYIDFGMYDVTRPGTSNFVNGFERSVVLDFNVDGNIIDLI